MIKPGTLNPEVETTSVFEKIDVLARTRPVREQETPAWTPPSVAPVTQPAPQFTPRLTLRQLVFRVVRLVLAGILICGAGVYFWNIITRVTSEQAVITTDILALRTPIEGILRMPPLTPGTVLSAGTEVFRVENPRFGNKEAAAQWNYVRDQVERLQAEVEEAAVRLAKQREIFAHYEKLYGQQLIARLDFVTEQSRLAAAEAAWSNKLAQLRQAEARSRQIEQQLALQQAATVTMPFTGAIWALAAADGAPVAANETVVRIFDPRRVWVEAFIHEKHADKFTLGTPVFIRTIDGQLVWEGRVEAIRGRGGPSTTDTVRSAMPAEPPPGRMAVRVKMERLNPFTAREFFGVGRSVVVSLDRP
jgi:multidrug resistance efflux pump